ncbi:MAG TPA: N-acetyltransferase [Candidatus Acidoferrales bacterium]
MIYRANRPDDFGALCEIDRICFPPGIAYPPQDLAFWLRQRGAFVIIAEDEPRSQVAGFILARKLRGPDGHIITIDLRPEHRRGGVGTELMTRAEQRLRELGATRVSLETSVENLPAIRFYERLGYQRQARLPAYYLGRIDAWVMARDL